MYINDIVTDIIPLRDADIITAITHIANSIITNILARLFLLSRKYINDGMDNVIYIAYTDGLDLDAKKIEEMPTIVTANMFF